MAFDFEGDPLTGCDTASGIGNPQALVLSPDQRQVLVAAGGGDQGSNAIVTLNRSTANGALSFASCVSEDGGDGRLGSDGVCQDGDGLSSADSVAITSDGRAVVATARRSSALTWFDRDPATGALTQRGCLKAWAWPGERCATAPLLGGASGVAVSPDGALVFVTASRSSSLSVYRRNVDSGSLERVACVSDSGSDGLCVNAAGLRGANDVVVAPDGHTVFVTAPQVGAVSVFDVDATSGQVHQRACLADLVAPGGQCTSVPSLGGAASAALSADGRDLYVGATGDAALTVLRQTSDGGFSPNGCFVFQSPQPGDAVYPDEVDDSEDGAPGTAGCEPVRALDPRELAISADGRSLFAAGDDYLDAFRRDPASGRLTWMACAEQEQTYKTCVRSRGLPGGSALATSADGRSLYVASNTTHSIAVFASAVGVSARATVTRSGRVRVALACSSARPVGCRGALRHGLIRGGHVAYALGRGAHETVSFLLRSPAPRHTRAITVTVTDATGLTRPVRHRIALVRSPRS